jgi:hypothetical protein
VWAEDYEKIYLPKAPSEEVIITHKPASPIKSLCFAGPHLATATGHDDQMVCVWELDGPFGTTLTPKAKCLHRLQQDDLVTSVCVVGKFLVVGCRDGTISVYW